MRYVGLCIINRIRKNGIVMHGLVCILHRVMEARSVEEYEKEA